jgi:hypothetical protein
MTACPFKDATEGDDWTFFDVDKSDGNVCRVFYEFKNWITRGINLEGDTDEQ